MANERIQNCPKGVIIIVENIVPSGTQQEGTIFCRIAKERVKVLRRRYEDGDGYNTCFGRVPPHICAGYDEETDEDD